MAAIESNPGSADAALPTILVVEDEVLIRLPLADFLRDNGFRVLEGANAAEARAVLDAGTPVDLLFSDINMPGPEDGIALAAWVRQSRPHIAVLLTSGAPHPAAKLEAVRGVAMLTKPYEFDDVAGRIAALLGGLSKNGPA
jgi:DNA-binding response OmpR family regulator